MTLCNGYEMIVMAVTRDSYSQGPYITQIVTQNMLRTHEGQSLIKTPIFVCSRSNQIPQTNQLTELHIVVIFVIYL